MIEKWYNLKTGKVYQVMNKEVINCTNGPNDQQKMVLYTDSSNMYFVREYIQFVTNFTRTKPNK